MGVPVVIGGDNLPSPVEIRLTELPNIGGASGPPGPPSSGTTVLSKEVFRTCNVLPFSCTHLALWRGKEEGLKLWLSI